MIQAATNVMTGAATQLVENQVGIVPTTMIVPPVVSATQMALAKKQDFALVTVTVLKATNAMTALAVFPKEAMLLAQAMHHAQVEATVKSPQAFALVAGLVMMTQILLT